MDDFKNIDGVIVIIFLFFTLFIGVIANKNIGKSRDFAISRGYFNTPSLLLSLLATLIGANSITGAMAEMHNVGILFFIAALGFVISMVLLAKFIVPNIDKRFSEMLSSSDILGYLYSSNDFKFYSAIVGYLVCTCFTVGQFIAIGYVLKIFLNIPFWMGVVVSGLIITIYSTTGGIKSIVLTDILQFFIVAVAVPIIAVIAKNKVGGLSILLDKVPESHMKVFSHPQFFEYLFYFLAYALPVGVLSPLLIQRYLMSNSTEQNQKITYTFAMAKLLLLITLLIIAFSSLILFPNIGGKEILPSLVKNTLPVGFKGFAICALLAAIMSSADSCLNTSGVIFAHNIIKKDKKAGDKKVLYKMKAATFTTGIISIFVSLYDFNIARMAASVESLSAIFIGLPLTFGLLGFKMPMRHLKYTIICLTSLLGSF